MPRRNRRRKEKTGLGFNPKKYINGKGRHGRHGYGDRDDVIAGAVRTARSMSGTQLQPKEVHRGEVWFVEFGSHPGTSVQEGCRPAVVISNDISNAKSETATVLPMTTRMKKYYLPTHVPVHADQLTDTDPGRPFHGSMVLAEQVTTVSRLAFVNYLGKITDPEKLSEIETALMHQAGIGADEDGMGPSDDADTLSVTADSMSQEAVNTVPAEEETL